MWMNLGRFPEEKSIEDLDSVVSFTINGNDKASYLKYDVIGKLPAPNCAGGTARNSNKFVFPVNLEKYYSKR